MLRWPHGGHGDCASARAGYGVRRWVRPAGARVGGRFTALQRARGRAEERSFAATTNFWLRLASGRVPVTRSGVAPTRAPREAGGVPEGNPFDAAVGMHAYVDLGRSLIS